MKVKLAKWGNSLGVRVPTAAAEAAGLKAGTEVEIVVQGDELRIRRSIPFKHYRLEDLIAEMKRLGPENEPETVEWGPDRGSEIIDDAYSRGEITLEDILKRSRALGDPSTPRKQRNVSRRR
jgi:antitoxin MazE